MAGLKMPTPNARSRDMSTRVMAEHRSGEHQDDAGGVKRPHKQGQGDAREPRRPHLMHGDDEFQSGGDGAEAGMKMPVAIAMT